MFTNLMRLMKNIVIINGHPNKDALNSAFVKAYIEGAEQSGTEIREITIADLEFNPNLQYGYRKRMDLEPDLIKAWEVILWADHLVWIHPVWWGGLPALMKGFIDRLFLPGMAFKYRTDSIFWDRLLKGKTGHIITTLDQPGWYYRLIYGRPSVNQLKKSTLQFCGVTPVKVSYIGIVKTANENLRIKWIEKVRGWGKENR